MKLDKLCILCINQKKLLKKHTITLSSQHKYKKMDAIFMNFKNSNTSRPHVFIIKLTNKLDLRRGEESISLSNLSIYYTWKT